jgi:hypothetical protein
MNTVQNQDQRPWRRRRYRVAGALAVVAALGSGGAFLARDTGRGATVNEVNASPSLTITNSGSLPKDHHTLRVVSAPGDLSGQHELAWAADQGHAVGNARCTQNFRIGPKATARVRPTMLLCWRTSPHRTVYTVAVDLDHLPSEQASVATINQVWSKLG